MKGKIDINHDTAHSLEPYLKRRFVGVKGLDGSWDDDTQQFQLVVPALYVTETHLAYRCPLCHATHRHGSGGDTFSRVESRSSHCRQSSRHEVEIVVTEATPRGRPLPQPRNTPATTPSGLQGASPPEAAAASCASL